MRRSHPTPGWFGSARQIQKVAVLILACLLATCMLVACSDDGGAGACTYDGHSYNLGDTFPKGDGCNSCTCTANGVACTKQSCADAGVDASPGFCGATGGCPEGPACGALCCGNGERCENGVCKCGQGSACGSGDNCEAPGPIGGNLCGSICCGATGPCPL